MMTGLLATAMSFAGIQQVEFEDDPEFHDACQVMTLQPESTRALLEAPLREYLTDHPGLTVRTEGPRLVVSRSGQRVTPDELAAFIDDTDNVAVSLARRGAQLESLGIDPEAEAKAALQRTPAFRGRIVPKQDLETFLEQPPPRSVPRTIKRQYLGFAGLLLYVWGGMFFVIGSTVVIGLVASGEMPILMAIPFSLLPLLGFGSIVLTFLFRRKRKRLLTRGVVRPARVTDVQSTNVTVNNQRRYKVVLQYEFEGLDLTGSHQRLRTGRSESLRPQRNGRRDPYPSRPHPHRSHPLDRQPPHAVAQISDPSTNPSTVHRRSTCHLLSATHNPLSTNPNPQPVIRQLHVLRQPRICRLIIKSMRNMREKRAPRPDSLNHPDRLRNTEMRRVRLLPQRIQNQRVQAFEILPTLVGNLVTVRRVGGVSNSKSEDVGIAVQQPKRLHMRLKHLERFHADRYELQLRPANARRPPALAETHTQMSTAAPPQPPARSATARAASACSRRSADHPNPGCDRRAHA